MIIIIDGYNLLRHIFPKVKGLLNKQRDNLIAQLGRYKAQKKESLEHLVVVFDAGPSFHATREIHHGVTVIFSGTKQSADDWILDYVPRYSDHEILLVTQDHELAKLCEEFRTNSIDVYDFYTIMKQVSHDQSALSHNVQDSDVEKYEDDYTDMFPQIIDKQDLDLLMEQGSLMSLPMKDNAEKAEPKKTGKLSRKEKRAYEKIKKLH
jgi:predicted RNA-binding protein with PIN domain